MLPQASWDVSGLNQVGIFILAKQDIIYKRKKSIWFLIAVLICKNKSPWHFCLCLSWTKSWEAAYLVLRITKLVGARQGAHPCPSLLPMERKWKRRRRSRTGAHTLSQLRSTPGFFSLRAAWDNKRMKFYTGNKKEGWKRMSFPRWLWKVKSLIRSQMEEYTRNAVQAVTELHTAVSKLPAKILGMFCGLLTVEGCFICSFTIWWVTGFVHQTLWFLFS